MCQGLVQGVHSLPVKGDVGPGAPGPGVAGGEGRQGQRWPGLGCGTVTEHAGVAFGSAAHVGLDGGAVRVRRAVFAHVAWTRRQLAVRGEHAVQRAVHGHI